MPRKQVLDRYRQNASLATCSLLSLCQKNILPLTILDSGVDASHGQLDIDQMAGIFMLFAAGIVIGICTIFIECCSAAYQDYKEDKFQKVIVTIINHN